MVTSPDDYNARSVEAEAQALWRTRRLPPAGGVLGPPSGPAVRQFEGSWTQGDFPSFIAHRALSADIDARYLSLAGRRAVGTLRQGSGPGRPPPSGIPALLTALGIWVGGDGRSPWDSEDRTAGVQAIVGRLAARGLLVTRDEAFRLCPTCGAPRSPERIVYNEEEGDTFLVRFPVRIGDSTANALVWVDAPWKLLGTSALLVNPDLTYVVATYRRREDHELVLTSAGSLHRLRKWIPEATFEVVEERPGKDLQGVAYSYPLRHEFPMGGDLTPPSGTILVANDVGESGTGIVPLVPGHGPTDARIAAQFGVTGWPLITPKGKLDFTLMHKYAGLDLDTANEFVERDLVETGAMLARLRVKRGVPHCTLCGTPLLWVPGRAWCLEASRLPVDRRSTFSRLLPRESLPGQVEVAPWPVSEASPSDGAGTIALRECNRCDRLEAPDGPELCSCGGPTSIVNRRLLPSSGAAFSAWARFDPFPEGDAVHLYVGRRRRVPTVVNHLAALSGVEGTIGEVTLTVVPTVAETDVPNLVATHGADAIRAALVRSGSSDAPGGRLPGQCPQEARRIGRWWRLSREVLAMSDPTMLATFTRPIGGFLGELETEDRAILARWERTRVLALAHYDQGVPNLVHRRVFRFLENDLVLYRSLVDSRLALAGTPTTKRAALRTLAHLMRGLSEILAPILPFTSEVVHRAFSGDRTSLFEQPLAGLDRSLLNDDLYAAWDRWRTVLRSLDRFRQSVGIPRAAAIPSLALVVSAEDVAGRFRQDKDVLARLARVDRLVVGSPKEPWAGRQRTIRPIETEIQKAYGSQASQIIHLLHRLPARRWEATAGQEDLSVVINGLPRRVFPSMVALTDSLPERVMPVPWSLGEMYAELPPGTNPARTPAPPLSPDAFWLVRRLDARLRALPERTAEARPVAVVTAKDPLAAELRAAAEPLARFLGLAEFRVTAASEEALPPNSMTGRTRTGEAWSVHVPSLPARVPRKKNRTAGARRPRVSVALSEAPAPAQEFDFSEESFVAHEHEVRVLGQELDDLIGVPLLGPSKVAVAWEHGVHSVADLRGTPYETLSTFPGFGGPVAAVVVEKLGGTVPPRTRPARRARVGTFVSPGSPTARPVPGATMIGRRAEALPAAAPSAPQIGPDRTDEILPPSPAQAAPLPDSPSPAEPPAPAPSSPEEQRTPEPDTLDEDLGTGPSALPEEPPASSIAGSPSSDSFPAHAPEQDQTPPPLALLPEPDTPSVGPGEPSAETMREPPEISHPEPPVEAPEPVAPPEEEVLVPDESYPVTAVPPSTTLPAEPAPEPAETATELPESPTPRSEAELPSPESVDAATPLEPEAAVPETADDSAEDSMSSGPSTAEPPTGPNPTVGGAGDVETPVESSAPEQPAESTTTEVPEAPLDLAESVPSISAVPGPPEIIDVAPPPERNAPVPEPEGEPATADLEPVSTEPAEPSLSTESTPAPPETGPEPTPPEVIEASAAAPTVPAPAPTVPEVVEPAGGALSSTDAPPGPPIEVVPPALAEPERRPTPSPEIPLPSVTPPVWTPPPEPTPPPPPTGVELTVGDSIVTGLVGFLESTAAGHHGVCVVRESPERIRARVGSRPIEVIWLTNIGRGPALRPSDLDGVWAFLCRKLFEERVTAFFLEGIEYLVRLHGADSVLTGLVEFDRLARENDARVWVFLAPALMKPADLDRFRGTFGVAADAS